MTSRRRSPCGPADSTQPDVIRAIELLGLQYRDLSRAGGGVEDLIVLIPESHWDTPYWLLIEVKVPSRKDGGVKASKYTKAQIEWRKQTKTGPRITVTSFADALVQLRDRMA